MPRQPETFAGGERMPPAQDDAGDRGARAGRSPRSTPRTDSHRPRRPSPAQADSDATSGSPAQSARSSRASPGHSSPVGTSDTPPPAERSMDRGMLTRAPGSHSGAVYLVAVTTGSLSHEDARLPWFVGSGGGHTPLALQASLLEQSADSHLGARWQAAAQRYERLCARLGGRRRYEAAAVAASLLAVCAAASAIPLVVPLLLVHLALARGCAAGRGVCSAVVQQRPFAAGLAVILLAATLRLLLPAVGWDLLLARLLFPPLALAVALCESNAWPSLDSGSDKGLATAIQGMRTPTEPGTDASVCIQLCGRAGDSTEFHLPRDFGLPTSSSTGDAARTVGAFRLPTSGDQLPAFATPSQLDHFILHCEDVGEVRPFESLCENFSG